jgi:hypothetical protein
MKRIRLEVSVSTAIGILISVFGILQIIIGPNSHMSNIIEGCAYIGLGVATGLSGIERLSNFQLNNIHQQLGPYGTRTLTLFNIRGYFLEFFGVCTYIGGSILLPFSLLRHLPVEYSDLSIVLLALGLAFTSLGRRHADVLKYDDIAIAISSIHENVAAINEESVKIMKELQTLRNNTDEKRREHYETNNISDFMPHGEIPPGLEC